MPVPFASAAARFVADEAPFGGTASPAPPSRVPTQRSSPLSSSRTQGIHSSRLSRRASSDDTKTRFVFFLNMFDFVRTAGARPDLPVPTSERSISSRTRFAGLTSAPSAPSSTSIASRPAACATERRLMRSRSSSVSRRTVRGSLRFSLTGCTNWSAAAGSTTRSPSALNFIRLYRHPVSDDGAAERRRKSVNAPVGAGLGAGDGDGPGDGVAPFGLGCSALTRFIAAAARTRSHQVSKLDRMATDTVQLIARQSPHIAALSYLAAQELCCPESPQSEPCPPPLRRNSHRSSRPSQPRARHARYASHGSPADPADSPGPPAADLLSLSSAVVDSMQRVGARVDAWAARAN